MGGRMGWFDDFGVTCVQGIEYTDCSIYFEVIM